MGGQEEQFKPDLWPHSLIINNDHYSTGQPLFGNYLLLDENKEPTCTVRFTKVDRCVLFTNVNLKCFDWLFLLTLYIMCLLSYKILQKYRQNQKGLKLKLGQHSNQILHNEIKSLQIIWLSYMCLDGKFQGEVKFYTSNLRRRQCTLMILCNNFTKYDS